MIFINNFDTIAAIATAAGVGAVGIVRISGKDALNILKRVFRPVKNFETHKMYYGKIFREEEVIDEVMICYMKNPRSFTMEDSAEIYCHGGMFITNEVLSIVLENGARLAEPGEFTKRAFLNGRINLSQAEAVADLISAKTAAARRAALRQLGGGLSAKIEAVRDKILVWLAHIELSIDYPEHEEEARNASEILAEADSVIFELKKLTETADVGRIIREGVRTAIIGRPNVGKSTLLNAILHENRAIVHETAGTTRDVLTEEVRIGDIPLLIMDTAGLRETHDPIEKIGIEKTTEVAEDAELILYVADATQGLTSEDIDIVKKYSGKNVIVLMNKSDIKDFTGNNCISISAKTGVGLDKVFSQIQKLFFSGSIGASGEADIITRERHKVLLTQSLEHLQNAKQELSYGIPEDLVSVSLRAAYINLGEILGAEIGDDIVDRIFAEFCVGK